MIYNKRLDRKTRRCFSRKNVARNWSKITYRSLALQPVDLFALLTDRISFRLASEDFYFQASAGRLSASTLDFATVPTGQSAQAGLPPAGLTASFAALKLLLPPRQGRGASCV
jgi:hypothetical protein